MGGSWAVWGSWAIGVGVDEVGWMKHPKLNSEFAPEKWWERKEDYIGLSFWEGGRPIFRGELLNFGEGKHPYFGGEEYYWNTYFYGCYRFRVPHLVYSAFMHSTDDG